MWLNIFWVFYYLGYNTCLTSSVSLDYSYVLPNFKAFMHLIRLYYDKKRLSFLSQKVYESITYLFNPALAIFKLSFISFYSVTNLKLQLWIISYGFFQSFIVQNIPFILVIFSKLVKLRSGSVYLKHFDFFEAWANVFGNELTSPDFLIQISISKHHFPPNVKILLHMLEIFFLAFIFNS